MPSRTGVDLLRSLEYIDGTGLIRVVVALVAIDAGRGAVFLSRADRERVVGEHDPPAIRAEITNRKIARLDDYQWKSCCRGLYQLLIAA